MKKVILALALAVSTSSFSQLAPPRKTIYLHLSNNKNQKMKKVTEQQFIDYMATYGTHVQFVYGDDIIQKKVHLTPHNCALSIGFPHITSDGKKYRMEFEINGKSSSIKDCAKLITEYQRDKKLNDLEI